ncbi:ADP-ribose pyrophosphatase [Candidatus Gugararchaeum adminiculabundum]|nr:ADP-ribose pyrophosphatase [Candidatus Gugararchaeum adminiculabundum]
MKLRDFQIQEINAGLVVKNSKGQYLMLERHNGLWEFPGGSIEWGEEPQVAAERECEEESGIRASTEKFLCITSATYEKEGKQKHAIYIFYFAKADGDIRPSHEHRQAKWFNLSELEYLKLALNSEQVLRHL